MAHLIGIAIGGLGGYYLCAGIDWVWRLDDGETVCLATLCTVLLSLAGFIVAGMF